MTPAALAAADRRGPPGRRKLLAEAGRVETAREIPGEEQVELPPFPDWMEEVAAEGPAPLVLGAFDGDEVVGMALIVFGEVPPGTALHWMTATRRSHRHRGIARALKRASL